MYTHLAKGFTVGQVLTRRLCRAITGAPGILIDAFLAVFNCCSRTGNYLAYWDETGMSYADGTAQSGIAQPLLGWIGDLAGALVGAIAGMGIGLACYFPDLILRGVAKLHDVIHDGCDWLAKTVGDHALFNDFKTFHNPKNYVQKAWNLSAGILGTVIAAPLYGICKLVEYFVSPLGNKLSNAAWKFGGITGGVLGSIAACAMWPVKHVCNKVVNLFHGFRDKVRSLTAFVYAKTDSAPLDQDECCSKEAYHSEQFKAKVREYKNESTTKILFGNLKAADGYLPVQEQKDPLIDPISHEQFEDPVIDHHGHTFSRGTIMQWLRQRQTCPLNQQPLEEKQLVPNRALADVLAKRG